MGAKSVTVRNGRGSRRHNIRDYKETPKHIDPQRSKDNVVLVDVPLWKAYRDIFGDAIDEYNAKQKRADRQYKGGAQAYLKEIMQEKGEMARKPFYETFVQIGDRNDTGLHDCSKEREALMEYMITFQERNPNLKVIGAYLHADEPNGTVHGHIDWVPVADGYKRGFAVQNGLKRALEQQGFKGTSKKYNAYLGWQLSEREALREICRKHEIEPKQSKSEGRAWLDKDTYVAQKQYEEALQKASEASERAEKAESRVKALERELEAHKAAVVDLRDMDNLADRARKTLFTGKIVRNKKDDEVLRKAAAHGATFDHQLRRTQEALEAERSRHNVTRDELKRTRSAFTELQRNVGRTAHKIKSAAKELTSPVLTDEERRKLVIQHFDAIAAEFARTHAKELREFELAERQKERDLERQASAEHASKTRVRTKER